MRNIYLSPSKRPSFVLRKLSFYHPKAYLLHPETYIFRKSKSTPFACRDAACRVKYLITNVLQKAPHRRPSLTRWTISPLRLFHAILRVKIPGTLTPNFNIFGFFISAMVMLFCRYVSRPLFLQRGFLVTSIE